jgi:hypothetical protein
VTVRLSEQVLDATALDDDIVVHATGALPRSTAVWRLRPTLIDGIPGSQGLPHGRDVLAGLRSVSGRVLVIDEEGGWPAVSLVETLAATPAVCTLTVATSFPGLGDPELAHSLELGAVTRRVRGLGLEVHPEALVERVEDDWVGLLGGGRLGPFDDIVLSTGSASPDLPANALAIGDAVAPRGLWAAATDAVQLARTL